MRRLRDALSPLRTTVAFGLLIALAVLVRLPLASAPLHLDDCMQRAMLDGTYPVPRNPFTLYSFVTDAADRRALLDAGGIAWWSDARFRLVMMRPLSSLLVAFDARFPSAAFAHLHSFGWFVLWAGASAALYRRVLGPGAAVAALALLLCDDAAAVPLSWVANRCVLVAGFFATLAVHGYLGWWARGGARRLGPVAAWTLLALAAGEYAVPVLAAIPAHALTARRDGRGRLGRVLLASVAVAAAYALARRLWGAGVRGFALYPDPVHDPAAFVAGLPPLAIRVLGDVAGGVSVDLPPPLSTGPALYALALGAALLWARRALAALGARPRRTLRWALLWCVAALLPISVSWLNSRMMAAPTMAASAAWALALVACASAWRARSGRAAALALGVAIAVVHGAGALAQSAVSQGNLLVLAHRSRRAAMSLLRDAPVAPGGRLVVLNAIDAETLFFGRYTRHQLGLSMPARWHALASTPSHLQARRIADDTLELSHPQTFLSGDGARLFNGRLAAMRPGTVVDLRGMRIEVVEVTAAGPSRVRVRFDRALDDDAITLAVSLPDGLHRVRAPAFGAVMDVPVAVPYGR